MSNHTVADVLAYAKDKAIPLSECLSLIAHTLVCDRSLVLAFSERPITTEQYQDLGHQLHQRAKGIPFAYLSGQQAFWSLNFTVTLDVLIPRPETELLVEEALLQLPKVNGETGEAGDAGTNIRVLELGTGSGCISVAIASERPHWQIVAVDASAQALAVARGNAQRLGCSNITFVQSDWYSALPAGFSCQAILSNPPYLAESDPYLATDIRHEPLEALVSGPTGLEAYEAIIEGAQLVLENNGLLIVEHGYTQAEQIICLLKSNGFLVLEQRYDLQGHPRVLVAQRV